MLKYLSLSVLSLTAVATETEIDLDTLLSLHHKSYGKSKINPITPVKGGLLGKFQSPLKRKPAELRPLELNVVAKQLRETSPFDSVKSRKQRTLEPVELKIAKRTPQKLDHLDRNIRRLQASRNILDQLSSLRDEARFTRPEARAQEAIKRMQNVSASRQRRALQSKNPRRVPRKITPIESRIVRADVLDSEDFAARNMRFAPARRSLMQRRNMRSKARQLRPVVRSDALMNRMSNIMSQRDKRVMMSKSLNRKRRDTRPIAVKIQKSRFGLRDPLAEMDLMRSLKVTKPLAVKHRSMGDPLARFQKRRAPGRKLLDTQMGLRLQARDQMSIDKKQALLRARMQQQRANIKPIGARLQKSKIGLRDPLSEMDVRRSRMSIKPIEDRI